jgi:hypothetical protein
MQRGPGLVRLALLTAALASLAALTPATALAAHVQCGDVITQDTRLDSDLQCSFGEGDGTALTIGAGNVTLDLHGHTISGPPFVNGSTGVAASGVTNVVVRNGTLRDFAADVLLQDVEGATVRGISGGSIRATGNGNTIRSNPGSGGIAVQGNDNLVSRNAVIGPLDPEDRRWIAVSGDDNAVTHNVVTNVGPAGAILTAYGILTRLHRGLVSHNVVTAAPGWLPTEDVHVTGMDITGDGTLVTQNVASGHVDGFAVRAPVTFTDNFAYSNFDDGIDVDVSGASLTRNEANGNGDLGIEAVPATIDGGGNRATGNGNPAQCIGVQCR